MDAEATKEAFSSMKNKAERRRVRKVKKTRKKQEEGGLSDRGYLIFCRALCIVHKRTNTVTFGKLQKAFTTWAFHSRHDASKDGTPLSPAQQDRLALRRQRVLTASKEHDIVTTDFNAHEAQYMEKIYTIRITRAKKERDGITREFEKINSKIEYIKDIEETNSRLQLSLLVKLAVLRLRAHTIITSMSATRERNRNMRQTIHDEIMNVKGSLSEYEEMEKKLLVSSSAHRDDYFSRLDRTRTRVSAVLEAQFGLKKDFDDNLLRQFQKEEEEENKAMEATGSSSYIAESP